MAGLFQVKDLAQRKRALAAESEAYRQLIRFDVKNLKFFSGGIKHRMRSASKTNYISSLLLLLPLATRFLRRGRRPPLSLAAAALLAWRLYTKMSPQLMSFISAFTASRKPSPPVRDREPTDIRY
jgi:hypothetical protein